MGLSRRLQNLIVENRLTSAKSLFSIDLTRQLFGNIAAHPSTRITDRSESALVQTPVAADAGNHQNQKYKQAEATAALEMERIQLPNPTLTFQASFRSTPERSAMQGPLLSPRGWWDALGRSAGRSFVFDVETRQTVMTPSLHVPKRTPFSLFVPYASADAEDEFWQTRYGWQMPRTRSSLFVMERIPEPEAIGSMRLGSFQFEAVVTKPIVFSDIDSWQCQLLPPPAYIHEPEYRDCYSRHKISYAVIHEDERFHVCISVNGIGTYCLDTVSRDWRKVGSWILPFRGRVEYVPELKLWFGLAAEAEGQHLALAAADLTDMDSQPQLVGSWKQLHLLEEEEWTGCKDSQLVNLGSGRFCITTSQGLNASSSVGDTDKQITVFTGVVVLPSLQDANGDSGEVGLQMIPHKSLCYKSDGSTIDSVF